jgi:hypothetical protein
VSGLRLRHFVPLAGFVLPTVVIGYGVVIPRSCIAGLDELTLGFAATVAGACLTYWAGLRLVAGPCGFLAGIDPSEVMVRRVLRPGGRALLGYRPRDTETLAALPGTVYALRSVDETEGLLAEAGFTAIRSTEHSIARSPFVCTEARS